MQAARSRADATHLPVILGLGIAFTITVLDPLVLSLNMPQVSPALQA